MSNITFVFQANGDGSATLTFDPPNGQPPGVAKVREDSPVAIRALPAPDDDDVIESVEMEFRDGSCKGWPFAGQDGPDLVWYAGDGPIDTSDIRGHWRFGAVLKSRNGHRYIVPDPELYVGDGQAGGT